MKHLRTLSLAALAASFLLGGAPAFAEKPLGADIEELLAYAREHNPEFAAMRQEADAAGERVYPAGALPDPVLRVELENVTNFGSNAAPNLLPGRVGDTKYTLMQPLPFWGKRDLKREAAAAEADAAKGSASATWTEQAARIKTAFAQYSATSQLIGLTREIIDLIDRLEAIAQARYANGLVPQQDAIRVHVERTQMRNEWELYT